MTGHMPAGQPSYTVDRRRVSREPQAAGFQEIDLKELFLVVWRSRKMIIGLTLLFAVLAAAWLAFQTPQYTAVSVIQINSRQAKILDEKEQVLTGEVAREDMAVQSEVDILRSPYIAGRVVDRLKLTENPEFNPALEGPGLKARLKGMLGLSEPVDPATAEEQARSKTIQALQENISISREPRSLTIKVKATSENARLAAKIANTIASEYLSDQLENRFDAAKNANQWLTGRLEELRDNLTRSELAVQAYREEHNLFDSRGLTVNDQQMSELNSQLILARAQRAETEAKLRQARQLLNSGTGLESSAEVLNSPLIQKLREQEAELASQEADMATRYGPKHPTMLKLRASLRDLQEKIAREVRKIVSSMENEASVSRSREASLEKSLSGAQQKVGANSAAEIKLSELEREMQTNRKLYETFLTRSKETAQQEDLATADARIISEATTPLKPSHPKKKLVLALAVFMGAGLGVALSLLLNQLDSTFRNLNHLERLSGYATLGALPSLPKGTSPLSYFREKPTSHFAESLRKIQSSAHFSNAEKPPQVIMITSSLTGEGKSLLTLSLAQAAVKAGLKVIVLDGDMRRPMVANYLHVEADHTLAEVLSGNMDWQKAVTKDEATGVHFLPSHINTANSNELLNTPAMDKLLKELREHYDLILLDTPPVAALIDSLTLARKVDTTIFAVHWGRTPKDIVLDSLKPFQMYRLPVAGLVLTQVDIEKNKGYGYYSAYYQGYNKYYHD